MSIRKAWERHQWSHAKKKDFHVWAKKVENYVSGVFRNVRGALSFAFESPGVVTAAAVVLGVA